MTLPSWYCFQLPILRSKNLPLLPWQFRTAPHAGLSTRYEIDSLEGIPFTTTRYFFVLFISATLSQNCSFTPRGPLPKVSLEKIASFRFFCLHLYQSHLVGEDSAAAGQVHWVERADRSPGRQEHLSEGRKDKVDLTSRDVDVSLATGRASEASGRA